MDTAERRQNLRDALIAAAEQAVAAHGLAGLKARELAAGAGCAVGAIYNVVQDLDELALAVNARTLADLEKALRLAMRDKSEDAGGRRKRAIARLARLAVAYVDFAAAHTARWRALFEHRVPEGREVPDWYLAEQGQLFAYVEAPLKALDPDLTPRELAELSRSLFSAVHGVVTLGLEEKLGVVPLPALREQTRLIASALGKGLAKKRAGG